MWQIRKYDGTNFWNGKYNLMELIKEVEVEPRDDGILLIDGKTYRWCAINHKNKVVVVEEIFFNSEPKGKEYGDDFKCPYCGMIDNDAWEMKDYSDIVECEYCGSEIEYERHVEVTYTVKPIKAAKIISLWRAKGGIL